MKRELNWGEMGDGQCKNDTFAMEGLCSLIFKAVWNKQNMQAFACCCVWLWVFLMHLFSGNRFFYWFKFWWVFIGFGSWCWWSLGQGMYYSVEIWDLLPLCLHPQVTDLFMWMQSFSFMASVWEKFLQVSYISPIPGIGSLIRLPYSM